jgi:hypothetical protein
LRDGADLRKEAFIKEGVTLCYMEVHEIGYSG